MLRFAVVCGAVAMFGAACGVHEPPQPGGTGQYLDAPTGVVDVMPDGVFPAAMVSPRSRSCCATAQRPSSRARPRAPRL